jgi:hypothetical protein
MSTERQGSEAPQGLRRRFGSSATSRLEQRVTEGTRPRRKAEPEPSEEAEEKKGKKVWLIVGLVVVAVLILAGVTFGILSARPRGGKGSGGSGSGGPTPAATQPAGTPSEGFASRFLPAQERSEKHWTGFRTFTGDVNGDGRADLIWNETTETNRIYVALGGADGTFAFLPNQDRTEKRWDGFRTFVGDVNGDGRADLIWNETAETNRVYMALGNADGTFAFLPAQDRTEKAWDTFETLVGDVNGDGRTDLIWNQMAETNRIYVALGTANGTLESRPFQDHPQKGWNGFEVLVGDINGDGRDDLLWNAHQEVNRVFVGLGNADGTFTFLAPQDHPEKGWNGFEVLVGDVNGDGRDDLVWNARQETNRIAVALGNTDGTLQFLPVQEHPEKGWGSFAALVGDVNGDGRADLVWNETRENNRTYIGLGNPDGTFQFLPAQDHPDKGWENYRTLLGDVNGDGRADLIWNSAQEINRIVVGLSSP